MQGVIFAAGRGSRLQPFSDVVPKALLLVSMGEKGPETIIDRTIDYAKKAKVRDIFVVVGYKARLIKDYLGSGKRHGVRIRYVTQSKRDGNGGALLRCRRHLSGSVFAFDVDNFVSDRSLFQRMRRKFEIQHSTALMGVSLVSNFSKFAMVRVSNSGHPIEIIEKPSKWSYPNLAKSGFSIFSAKALRTPRRHWMTNEGEYTTTHLFKHLLSTKQTVSIERIRGTYFDIGTWDDYRRAVRAGFL